MIIVSKEGQLANRIVHASSFMVNAHEHNYRVKHLFFNDYYSFFSESLEKKDQPIRFWGKRSSWVINFFQNTVSFLVKALLKLRIKRLPFFEIIKYEGYDQDAIPFDLNKEEYLNKAKSKLVLVHGWLFRDRENLQTHKEVLINNWTPNNRFRENIDRYYMQYKKDHDILIGVHIRGGDYKKFEGGKWYYTQEQYYAKMKEVACLRSFSGKKVAFVICTNEKDISILSSNDFSVFNEERHFVEDLYLLAKCDYIIGPPSTFSMWASFYGNVPLYMINEMNSQLTEDCFDSKITFF